MRKINSVFMVVLQSIFLSRREPAKITLGVTSGKRLCAHKLHLNHLCEGIIQHAPGADGQIGHAACVEIFGHRAADHVEAETPLRGYVESAVTRRVERE